MHEQYQVLLHENVYKVFMIVSIQYLFGSTNNPFLPSSSAGIGCVYKYSSSSLLIVYIMIMVVNVTTAPIMITIFSSLSVHI